MSSSPNTDEPDDDELRRTAIVFGVGFEGMLGLLAIALAWLFGRELLTRLRWNAIDAAWGFAAAVPLLIPLLIRFGPLEEIRRFVQEHLGPYMRACSISDLASISLAAGFGEELLMRGLIQAALIDATNVAAGILLASLIFGFLHAVSRIYFIYATLIGVYLGVLFWHTENLLAPMICHAFYDFVALVYCRRNMDRPEPPPASTAS